MVDSAYYCDEIVTPFEKRANQVHKKWILQQDNATPHVCPESAEWMKSRGIKFIKHPPQSPDLNPIELVWNLLKRKIEELKPRNFTELQLYCQKAWETIDDHSIRAIIRRLRKVMRQVLKANGDNVFVETMFLILRRTFKHF